MQTGFRSFLITVCLTGAVTSLWAQIETRQFSKLTTRDGLSNSTIFCIYQDKKGFIWVGTNDGLDRYDGYQFRVYNHNDSDPYSISADQINSMAEDKAGNLWIGVWDGGLNFYDHETDRFVSYKHRADDSTSLSGDNVYKVFVDRENRLWAGTRYNGLNLFDESTHTFKRFLHRNDDPKSICGNEISSIIEDRQGNLWIGTYNSGISCLNRNKTGFISYRHDKNDGESITSNNVNTLFEDPGGKIWIGTLDNGLSILDPERKIFSNYSPDNNPGTINCNNIKCINQDRDGVQWIGTDGGGINFYHPGSKSFNYTKHNPGFSNSLNSNTALCIYRSRDDIIWVGTFQGGLNIYDRSRDKFRSYHEYTSLGNGLSYKSVMSVYEDHDGVLWLGTDGGGLNRFNDETNTFTYYEHNDQNPGSISGNAVKSICEDSDGYLWIGTFFNGMNRFDKKKNQFIRFINNPSDPYSLSRNDVWDIIEDSRRNLWIATLNGGLNLLDRGTMKFRHFETGNSPGILCSDFIVSLENDKNSKGIWIGTNNGLSYYDPDNNYFTSYQHDEKKTGSLSNNNINDVYEDSQGNLWISTTKGGANKLSPGSGSFIKYDLTNGLSGNFVAAILEDNHHNIWMSTNQGISCLNNATREIRNFSALDGLQSNEFLPGSACKRKNGDLVFGGINGFEVINPSRITTNLHIPEIYITRLIINNKEVSPGMKNSPLSKMIWETGEITLHHFQNTVSFEFTALSYTNSEKNQYAYNLEGFDREWNYIGSRRLITFTNLEPKTYTLRVKAANNDGLWNDKGIALIIHQLPPWWNTWWARVGVVLVIAGMLYSYYLYRIRSIRNRNFILKKLVAERTGELAREKDKVEDRNNELLQKQSEIVGQNEKILKQNEEIKEMSERVHRSDEEKLKFFTNISHEIRTPLTLILSPLEKMMASAGLNETTRQQISRVHRNANSLMRLINQILDFRKIDSIDYKLRASRTEIIHAIKEITASFYDISLQKNIKFSLTSTKESIEAWIDIEKFDKIIINLLSNAYKFTPPGGNISVNIAITSGDPVEWVSITVSDSGIGIPRDQLEKIFIRFYQTEKSAIKFPGGTGIGLSIVKSLTELHHGKISCESEEGKGSTFTLLLPLGRNHLSDEEITEGYESESYFEKSTVKTGETDDEIVLDSGSGNNKPSIMVVDDNQDLRYFIRDCLKEEYTILEAENGKEGIRMARNLQPRIIISDIMMPEVDGLELCKKIKEDIETSHIPIILLTAKSSIEHRLAGLECGADDYIAKPFNYRELSVRVKNLILSRKKLIEKFSRELVLKPGDITITSTDEKFLQKAIEIVERNIQDPDFDVSAFAEEIGMSRSLFYMKLKELTNQPVKGFINLLRLKRAAQLLSGQKLSVSEVCDLVGYNDPAYFSKSFRKMFGTAPANYAGFIAREN